MLLPDFIYILPLLLVGIGAITLMLLSTVANLSIRQGTFYSLFFLIAAVTCNIYNLSSSEEGMYSLYPFAEQFKEMLIVDTFSGYFSTILLFGGILTLLIGVRYFEKNREFTLEFFSLFLFSIFGMLVLVHANELITAFIALEIASISLYVMIGFQKSVNKRIEAGFRYLVLGSLAGVIFLLGVLFIYAGAHSTKISQIGAYITLNSTNDMTLLIMGGSMILITFLFKIAAFPFQNWALDVYDGAPLPVTAFMAATFKAALFGFTLRLIIVDFEPIRDVWDTLFIFIIVCTLAYGSFLAVIQKSLKRMLVASSMVHTGYMLIAFMSIGEIGQSAGSSVIFYLVAYFLSALGAFGLLSYIASNDKLRISYKDFEGFAHIRPYMAAMLSVFMLSLAGIPSTIGFIGKFYIFTGAIEAGYPLLAVMGILATFVSIYYYFRLIAIMYFYPSAQMHNVPPLKGIAPAVIGLITLAIIWGGVGNTLIGYFPGVDFLIDMAKLAYESLFIS